MRFHARPLAALALPFFVFACGGQPATSEAPVTESTTAEKLIAPPPGSSTTVTNPGLPYFADVTANGTGCPAGTWNVNIDPSGQTFTLTFSSYDISLSPGQALAVRDCQIGINLHSPQGLSYSIAQFFYSGYAFLDSPGMSARQTAHYYFQGNPIEAEKGNTSLSGPVDQEYTYQDNVPIADLVWSPCGAQRLLNVSTRILEMNNPQKTGTGYMNTLAVDGNITLRFKLSWRSC